MARWIKPTLDTSFNIDFNWWEETDRDLRVYLYHHLCKDCREIYSSYLDAEIIDWVDPDTAEVQPVDGLWHTLRTHCCLEADYITEATPLIDAAFRVFLANGNVPLTPAQLSAKISHSPEKILRVLASGRVYDGIRPV